MAADLNRVQAVFLKAVEATSPAERAAILAQECGDDEALRLRVNALLKAHDDPASFMESLEATGAQAAGPSACRDVAEGPGDVIGPYKLLQQIGEGGFGVVYMAEQEKPVRRMVALKIIKAGMDTAQVIARFESERQALAIMDHPNVAKVFDAGATDGQPGRVSAGRPYFVMELVKGVPITEFCDKNHMPAEQRLKLFLDVCHAIQHAHHKGIIHRDIKPSNVMVTLHDGVPVVKVIDFGVAKATVQKLTERTLFTAYGQMIGTPAYMSPEQAEMSGLDIDTRSDIYSLGVLLYELLTGTTPLDVQRLRKAGYAEMQRLIREEEPPRPSTRLSALMASRGASASGESAEILAGNRGTDVRQLSRLLAGDLDWIVMKALEKDRNRRYGTPGNFAEDIERYMRREAILARPPTTAYKLKKFAQRNRVAVLTTAAVVAALVLGTGVATWQAVAATQAKKAAIEAADSEKKAKETAEQREAETKAVLDFVQSKVFAAARPQGQEGGLGHDVTMRKAIEAALPFVEEGFKHQPFIESRLRNTLGMSFAFLGQARTAAEQFEKSRLLRVQHLGPDHPETVASMRYLANSYEMLGRDAEALKLREETLALQKAKLGPDHPDTLTNVNDVANSYSALGRHEEALKLREETVALQKVKRGPDHPETLRGMQNLANSYGVLGRHEEALKLREETLALQKARLGPDHPETLGSMHNLAVSYDAFGRHEEALKLREETLVLQNAKVGPDHPDMLMSMNNLGNTFAALGRHAEALKLREETLALRKAKLGADHRDTLMSMYNLAISFGDLGRHAEALRLHEETLALRKVKLGPDHPDTLLSMNNVACRYTALGRHAEALRLHEETLALRKAKLGPDHADTLISMGNLINSYAAADRTQEAIKLVEEALPLRKVRLGPDHPETLESMNHLAWLLATATDVKLRDPARAVELAAQATEKSPKSAMYRNNLGTARYRAGDWKGAIADLEQAINLRNSDDPTNAYSGFFLAMAHWQLGDKDKAREWFDKSVAWMDKGKKDDAELKRFRAEAAELLEISAEP